MADFWTLLRELDKRGRLAGRRSSRSRSAWGRGRARALWLDRFQALDEERGTGYYPRLRFLLGDYSMPTLDRRAVGRRAHIASWSASWPWTPTTRSRSLSFLRYKILSIHLTNVYDNLAVDELVRRDGRLYLVEARAYLAAEVAAQIAGDFGVTPGRDDARDRAATRAGSGGARRSRTRRHAFWR